MTQKKYLIITSSGGGGHVNAAEARKAELIALGIKELDIDIIDLMGVSEKAANGPKKEKDKITPGNPWVPTYGLLGMTTIFSGELNTQKWNEKQKEGTEQAVRELEGLVEMQPLAEAMQAKEVEKRLKEYLKENDVQAIYNTQALSTPAICQAVCDYNHEKNKPLTILTTVTDLITHRAEHFLSSLRKLTKSQVDVLKMEIPDAPLLDPGETEEEFYAKYGIQTGLFIPKGKLEINDAGEIVFKEAPKGAYPSSVKQEYLNDHKEDQKTILIKALSLNGESKYIKGKIGEGVTVEGDNISITKTDKDKLITITMGSQGSNSVFEYMEHFADQIKKTPPSSDGKIYLCIAAGKNETGSLYEKVKDRAVEIEKMHILPKNVKILPLAFQDADHMASLLNNSDILITRSGGMSSMEAKATNGRNPNRRVFVHSEAKLKDPKKFPKDSYDATYEALMKGTVKWEGGNAEYLLRNIGASLGSPETIDFVKSLKGGKDADPKENSLFHFAYDGKMRAGNKKAENDKEKEDNRKKIKELILEGSNPNLRFPGGSYLIDHCKDFRTTKLLVQHGAKITAKSIDNIKKLHLDNGKLKKDTPEYKKQEAKVNRAINYLKKIERDFDPKKIYQNKNYETVGANLYPDKFLQPKTWQEKTVVAMDNAGDFINKNLLNADKVNNYIAGIKLSIATDPTEPRSISKRLRQVRNFAFDAAVFAAKQPVNIVKKPLELVSNTFKAAVIGSGMLSAAATGEESKICNAEKLKYTGWKMLENLGDSVTAAASAALIFSGFGAPLVIGVGGVSASVSLGAANFGAFTPVVTTLNAGMSQAVAMTTTGAANAVLTAEGVAEWGVVRPLLYRQLNPLKYFYDKDTGTLNSIGQKISDLHKQAADPNNSIEIRRVAEAEKNKLLKQQTLDKIVAPALTTIMPLLKEEADKTSQIVNSLDSKKIKRSDSVSSIDSNVSTASTDSMSSTISISSTSSTDSLSSAQSLSSVVEKRKAPSKLLDYPIIGVPVGAAVGTTVLALSLARGAVGTIGNASLALGGTAVAAGAFGVHLLNFASVKVQKATGVTFGLDLKDQLKLTGSWFIGATNFTSQKASNAIHSVPNVLSGVADKKIIEKLGNAGVNNKADTSDILIDSYRLAMGMKKDERKSAVKKLNEQRSKSKTYRNIF